MNDLIINESNFNQYFFDIRNSKYEKGQVIAEYTAVAELISSNEKKLLINLLYGDKRANSITQFMRKVFCAKEPDTFRVPREMCEDLLSGKSEEYVLNKPYKFVMRMGFFTKSEHVPKNDPHWSIISLEDNGMIKSKIVKQEDI